MFSRFQHLKGSTPVPSPTVTERSLETGEGFFRSLDVMRRRGILPTEDPRHQIPRERAKELSRLSPSEIQDTFRMLASHQAETSPNRDVRVLAMAAGKLFDQQDKDPQRGAPRGSLTTGMERSALAMARIDPEDRTAQEMLSLSAAACIRDQRDRVGIGFETGSIARAAAKQGRSWIDVRDDLMRHELIDRRDPRTRIKSVDVAAQKFDLDPGRSLLTAEGIERKAMAALALRPADPDALGLLARAGAMTEQPTNIHRRTDSDVDKLRDKRPRISPFSSPGFSGRRKGAGQIEL